MSKRQTTQEFIERAKKLHPEYDYSKVNYIKNSIKVNIICPSHGMFSITPNNLFSQNRGCPICGRNRIKVSPEEFISRARELYGDFYTYDGLNLIGANNKVTITCPKHGVFQPKAKSFLEGHGCYKCGKERYRLSQEEFISRIRKGYISKNYNYSFEKTKYATYYKDVIITCKEHGDFSISAQLALQFTRCPTCYRLSIRSSTQEFIKKAKELHGDKYLYDKVDYITSTDKVLIGCKIHGYWKVTPYSHLSKSKVGCPKCCLNQTSYSEKECLGYLKISDSQFRIGRYQVDGFDQDTNTVYEFLGDYFHGNPEKYKDNMNKINHMSKKSMQQLYNETFARFEKIAKLGYNIKYIWESDWNKFKDGEVKELKINTYNLPEEATIAIEPKLEIPVTVFTSAV